MKIIRYLLYILLSLLVLSFPLAMTILCGFVAKYNSDINDMNTAVFASIGCAFFGICFISYASDFIYQFYKYCCDPYHITNPTILPISMGTQLKEIIIMTQTYDAKRTVGLKT